MLNDSDEATADDGKMYLDAYGILPSSTEGLDAEVLLDSFIDEEDE